MSNHKTFDWNDTKAYGYLADCLAHTEFDITTVGTYRADVKVGHRTIASIYLEADRDNDRWTATTKFLWNVNRRGAQRVLKENSMWALRSQLVEDARSAKAYDDRMAALNERRRVVEARMEAEVERLRLATQDLRPKERKWGKGLVYKRYEGPDFPDLHIRFSLIEDERFTISISGIYVPSVDAAEAVLRCILDEDAAAI